MSRCKAMAFVYLQGQIWIHLISLQGPELKKWKLFRQKLGLQAEKKAAKLRLEAAKKFAKRP
jgi:hypothetical protein